MGAPSTRSKVALKRAIQDDSCRQQAKDAYDAHNKATGSLDLLDRCKKLNQFLASVRTPARGQGGDSVFMKW